MHIGDNSESSKNLSHSNKDLQSLDLDELKKKLQFSPNGLSNDEAKKRLAEFGWNIIHEKKTNIYFKFVSYFWGPIPWMIELAMILSTITRHWVDFLIIGVLLIANALIGFLEENKAASAIAALKAKLAVMSRVKRQGEWSEVAARELVPGDIIRLRPGDIIPADVRLILGDPIEVDQSALTGESLPVELKVYDVAFSGSIVRQGEIEALVYATGSSTYFGKTAELMQDVGAISHFQKTVLKIGRYLIYLAIALVSLIVMVALIRGDNILTTLQFALVLTVAAIPVALPTVLSVTMAVGARLLAKKKAIVSRLVSIEELAGVDILCADKTGTLTQNKLTLGAPFSVQGIEPSDVLFYAALASRAENHDVIDSAIIDTQTGNPSFKDYKILHFQPFDPIHRRTEAQIQDSRGHKFKVAKGAPQVILQLTKQNAQTQKSAMEAINAFASRGYRSLGVARATESGNWQFLGIIPLFDPPREDAKDTISTAKKMGIKIKMLTGDQLAIARDVAQKLGLNGDIFDAGTFEASSKQQKLADVIERADGFAQVFPEHKFQIVKVLQEKGHIVAMTGDGVNDSPALKKADCGIAVSNATDTARAAASIVLLNPGLAVIIDAVKESRKIFQRMKSYAVYRIAETLRVLFFMTASIICFNFYPLTAVMIIFLALLNDGAILSIAYDNVHYQDKPETWNMRSVMSIAFLLGMTGPIESFSLFFLADKVFHLDRSVLQSLMYLKLSVAGHMTIFLTRTRGPFWSIRPAPILWMAVLGTQIIATLIAVYGFLMPPLGWKWAVFVWIYAAIWILLNDRLKLLTYRVIDSR